MSQNQQATDFINTEEEKKETTNGEQIIHELGL